MADFTGKYELFRPYYQLLEMLRKLPSLVGKRVMNKLEDAVAIIQSMAQTLPEHHPFIERGELARMLQAAADFRALTPFTTPESVNGFIQSTREHHPQPNDPTMDVTCQLFWYFSNKCELPKNEAEVRTAKIGNQFFGWGVEATEEHDGAQQWKGQPPSASVSPATAPRKTRPNRDVLTVAEAHCRKFRAFFSIVLGQSLRHFVFSTRRTAS